MQANMGLQTPVFVSMLNQCKLRVGSTEIACKKHVGLVWVLCCILLSHWKTPLSLHELCDALWDAGNTERDTSNSLKNLIYRARTLLSSSFPDIQEPLVVFHDGTYCWNQQYPVSSDVKMFEAAYAAAQTAGSPDEVLAFTRQAMRAYAGPFLPEQQRCPWVLKKRKDLEQCLSQLTQTACSALWQLNRKEDTLQLCEEMQRKAPCCLPLYRVHMRCCMAQQDFSQALHIYNTAITSFYKSTGTDISLQLRDLYQEILTRFDHTQMDIRGILEELEETAHTRTAYYCDYETFRNQYNIRLRNCRRDGRPATLVLVNLVQANGSTPTREQAMKEQNELKISALASLRGGDVLTAFSDTQFLILLPNARVQDASKAMQRVLIHYHQNCRRNSVKVMIKYHAVLLPGPAKEALF